MLECQRLFNVCYSAFIQVSKSNISSTLLQHMLSLLNYHRINKHVPAWSADCGHGLNFKSICIACLAKYFENEEGEHLVCPTFAQ